MAGDDDEPAAGRATKEETMKAMHITKLAAKAVLGTAAYLAAIGALIYPVVAAAGYV